MQAKVLQKSFTKRYILAITLIAILSSIAFYSLHYSLKLSDSTALHVNMAGKQRMLSQRIALLSHHYATHLQEGNVDLHSKIKNDLENSIQAMDEANKKLSTGKLSPILNVKLSATLHDLYFGKTALKSRVENYLAMANQVMLSDNDAEMRHLSHTLTLLANDILPDLNTVVSQAQKEGESNLASIKKIEIIAWILTCITLLLEIIFIFRPMSHKIGELFEELVLNDKNLESEIERRTEALEATNRKLMQLASHDPLTGLKNRLNLEQDLENLLIHFKENHHPFAVAMVDIDWFKKINDNHGHDVGDQVLKELSFLIANATRIEDSVYRAGGEEFVIIFNRISATQAIEKMGVMKKTRG